MLGLKNHPLVSWLVTAAVRTILNGAKTGLGNPTIGSSIPSTRTAHLKGNNRWLNNPKPQKKEEAL